MVSQMSIYLHWTFYRQQALGKAEPLVKVYLRLNVKAPIDLTPTGAWLPVGLCPYLGQSCVSKKAGGGV